MRTRATTLFLACALFVSLVAVAPAQAACRPTTLTDLFPPVPETTIPGSPAPPVPTPVAPLIEAVAPPTTTTTASVPTTVTTATTTPTATTTTTAAGTSTTIDPNNLPATTTTLPTTTTIADPNASTPTTTSVPTQPPVARCSYVYRMQWPVLGGGAVLSTFGADRDGGSRHHAGVDISAAKMTPVVAVRDGTIRTLHAHGTDCCAIGITHDDGWSSYYLHLNNDVDGSDNGHGIGIRPDLVIGTRVVAGEVIGWVGDSGNAEPTTPHVHFELHGRNGVAIDPLASLRWAFRRMPAPALEYGPTSFAGPYYDDDGLPAEPTFRLLASLGVVRSCDAWNAAVCPESDATILDAIDWISALSRVLIPVAGPQTSTEIVDQIIEDARTCPADGCPQPPITVGTAASILLWVEEQRAYDDALAALEQAMDTDPELTSSIVVPPVPEPYWFIDPSAAAAILTSRGMADNCPIATPVFNQVLTRAQLAEMIGKAFGYLPIVICGAVA